MRFRDKFVRFMYGRYGTDALHKFLTITFFAMWIVNLFLNSIILYMIMLGLLLWQMLRVFSRNHAARQRENLAYLKIKNGVGGAFKKTRLRIKDIKSFRYRTCPGCKATLRLPRRKGKHTAKCPRCGREFDVHIGI